MVVLLFRLRRTKKSSPLLFHLPSDIYREYSRYDQHQHVGSTHGMISIELQSAANTPSSFPVVSPGSTWRYSPLLGQTAALMLPLYLTGRSYSLPVRSSFQVYLYVWGGRGTVVVPREVGRRSGLAAVCWVYYNRHNFKHPFGHRHHHHHHNRAALYNEECCTCQVPVM